MDTSEYERLRCGVANPERSENDVRDLIAQARNESDEKTQFRFLFMIEGSEERISSNNDYIWRQMRLMELTPIVVNLLIDEARDGDLDSLRWAAYLTDWTRPRRQSYFKIFTGRRFAPPSDWNDLMKKLLGARPKAPQEAAPKAPSTKIPARL